MPRVSVLLPSYNHEAFLREAVASVLGQTLTDLELVIVDDGSTDGSWALIEGFDDPRIVRHRQENRGAHAALNKAHELASAESELVAILNSDDAWDPRWLEVALGTLAARPAAGFCSALLRLIGPEQDPRMAWRRSWYQDALRGYRGSGDLEAALLRANFIMTTSNVVVRRDRYRAAGGFRALRYVHDLDFFLRLAGDSELALVEQELVTYRYHEANTIRETAHDERRIVFEFGWILADLLERVVARTPDPALRQRRVLDLVRAQPKPAVGAVALALLAPRAASVRETTRSRPPLEGLLREDDPVRSALVAAELDPRGTQVAEMEAAIADQLRALASLERGYAELQRAYAELQRAYAELDRAYKELGQAREQELGAHRQMLKLAEDNRQELERGIHALTAEVARLKRTRAFRIGEAISASHGLADALRLPLQLTRIALEKRERGETWKRGLFMSHLLRPRKPPVWTALQHRSRSSTTMQVVSGRDRRCALPDRRFRGLATVFMNSPR